MTYQFSKPTTEREQSDARWALYDKLSKKLTDAAANAAAAALRHKNPYTAEHQQCARRMLDVTDARADLSKAMRSGGMLMVPDFPPLRLDDDSMYQDAFEKPEPLLAPRVSTGPMAAPTVPFDDLKPPRDDLDGVSL